MASGQSSLDVWGLPVAGRRSPLAGRGRLGAPLPRLSDGDAGRSRSLWLRAAGGSSRSPGSQAECETGEAAAPPASLQSWAPVRRLLAKAVGVRGRLTDQTSVSLDHWRLRAYQPCCRSGKGRRRCSSGTRVATASPAGTCHHPRAPRGRTGGRQRERRRSTRSRRRRCSSRVATLARSFRGRRNH